MDTQTALIILAGLTFCYLILYKKNKLAGNIGFMIIGAGTALGGDNNSQIIIGVLLVAGGLISAIYDIARKLGK